MLEQALRYLAKGEKDIKTKGRIEDLKLHSKIAILYCTHKCILCT